MWAARDLGPGPSTVPARWAIPFAGYKDFAACVAANSDKADPKAYCGTIQAQAEKRATIAKVDPRGLVYGWANVVKKDGALIEDTQGDLIEPDELEGAMVDFMLHHRAAGAMHQGEATGTIVESFVMTPTKLEAMGFEKSIAEAMPCGTWIGVQLDPKGETFRKVQEGVYKMFSIQGSAKRVEV